MFEGIPIWGKVLALLAGISIVVALCSLTKENLKLRKQGNFSKRKLTEIIVGSTLTIIFGVATLLIMWKFVS